MPLLTDHKAIINFGVQAEAAARQHTKTMQAIKKAFPDAVIIDDLVIIDIESADAQERLAQLEALLKEVPGEFLTTWSKK